MLVSLDTRDLITLERDKGSLLDRLEGGLRSAHAYLALSFVVVNELAGASRKGSGDGFMRLLIRLEAIPHTWIRHVDLPAREISQALECFINGGQYTAPAPYVASYFDTWNWTDDQRAQWGSRSLAEIMWDQRYLERQVGPLRLTLGRFPALIRSQREEIARLTEAEYRAEVEKAFVGIARRLASEAVGEEAVDLDAFAQAAWDHPEWCPGRRLHFEVQHAFQYDSRTEARHSDPLDFVRVQEIPYVDVFTCDKSKRAYLRQLAQSRNSRLRDCGYWRQCDIVDSVREVIERLEDEPPTT
jgi:hypothetical protein